MQYDKVRDTIKDGSIVFIDAKTLPQKIITFFTGGVYSHVGMAVWMSDSQGVKKLMIIESTTGGARLVQLSAYLYRGFTVVDLGLNWTECSDSAFADLGILHYSILNLALIGIKSILGRLGLKRLAKMIPRDTSGEVCSEFVATLMDEHGYSIDSFTSPTELYEIVCQLPGFMRATNVDPVIPG